MKQVESGKPGAHHDYIEFTNRLTGIFSGASSVTLHSFT